MTRQEFGALLRRCVTETGAAYVAAREAVRAAGAEVDPWLAEARVGADPREAAAAEILAGWRANGALYARVAAEGAAAAVPDLGPRPVGGALSPTTRAATLAAYEAEVVPRLVELVTKGEGAPDGAREAARLALAYLRDPRAVPPLLDQAARGATPGERASALATLGELRDPRAVDVALAALAAPDAPPAVRMSAAAALGQLGDRRATVAVAAAAGSARESRPVRESATRALGMLGDAAAIPVLATLAAGADERLALTAVEALGQLGGAAAASALGEVAGTHAASLVRQAARHARATLTA